jgi:hypothetical protein
MAKEAKDSFMVDLNTECRIDEESEGKPGIDQIEAFINKVKTEITKGDIPETIGQDLINKATSLIGMIKT